MFDSKLSIVLIFGDAINTILYFACDYPHGNLITQLKRKNSHSSYDQ